MRWSAPGVVDAAVAERLIDDVDVERLYSIEGQPPALHALPRGCSFAPRCAQAHGICLERAPPMFDVAPGQKAACWKHDPNAR
jgi:oligopeptide/dipeptide ABC transporter ATP-binding protein